MDDRVYHAWQQEQKILQLQDALTILAEQHELLKAENKRLRKYHSWWVQLRRLASMKSTNSMILSDAMNVVEQRGEEEE